MAVANIAWLLASNEHKVLVIDWDMEAPGLHHYFRPFLPDPTLTAYGVHGVIDAVLEYAAEAATPAAESSDQSGGRRASQWFAPYADIAQHAIPLRWPSGERLQFGDRGAIHFIPSGRQDSLYARRVNSFDWKHLYEELGGRDFFESMRNSFGEYDYVIIDSRTGVSDTSGICTIQMPHKLVLCFTLNNQSISGAANVAATIAAARPDMPIYPAAFRVDGSEREKLNQRRGYCQETFQASLEHLRKVAPHADLDEYWKRVEVPYFPIYAYEETLSPFELFSERYGSLLPSFEQLGSVLTGGKLRLGYPPEKERRDTVVAVYSALPTSLIRANSEQKESPARWVRFVVAAALWCAVAGALVWATLSTIGSASANHVLANALVRYAEEHEDDVPEASSALAAAAGLPVPDKAKQIALKVVRKGVPSVFLPGDFDRAALSPQGALAATAGSSLVSVWNLATGRIQESTMRWIDLQDAGTGLQFSADGSKCTLFGHFFGRVNAAVYDVPTLKKLWTAKVDTGVVKAAAFSPDGARWALLVDNHRIGRNPQTGEAIKDQTSFVANYTIGGPNKIELTSTFPDSHATMNLQQAYKALSADANSVAITDYKTVSVWAIPAEKQIVARNLPPSPPILRAVFNASLSKMLVIFAESARVLDLSTGSLAPNIPFVMSQTPSALALSSQGYVALAYPGNLHVYSANGNEMMKVTVPPQSIRDLSFSSDGTLVYALFGTIFDSRSSQSGLYVWRVQTVPLSSDSSWAQLNDYLKRARGSCMTIGARESIYGESVDAATRAVNQCIAGK